MDSDGRFRAALWLRAEQAMGLDWVPRPTRPVTLPPSLNHKQAQTTLAAASIPPAAGTSPPAKATAPRPQPSRPAPSAPSAPPPRPPASSVVVPLFSTQPLASGPALPLDEKQRLLAQMNENEVRGCTKCRLCEGRTHTVFGDGDPNAKLLFIGEGPGQEEDRTGQPFVGRSGKLLDKMIRAMGLSRQTVFITNIVKCRPPGNRVPMPDEVAACTPYLIRQLEIIRPQVIVTLGLAAARYMLGNPKLSMGRIRGLWHDWRGVKLMPTYHPSYVLRTYTDEVRGMVWSDLQQVMKELGLPLKQRP